MAKRYIQYLCCYLVPGELLTSPWGDSRKWMVGWVREHDLTKRWFLRLRRAHAKRALLLLPHHRETRHTRPNHHDPRLLPFVLGRSKATLGGVSPQLVTIRHSWTDVNLP